METLVQFIFLVSLIKYCLKASLTGGLWAIICYALFCSLWAFICYPLVIHQPVTLIEQLLNNKKIVTDGAVITTFEAIMGILLSIRLLDNYFTPKTRRKKSLFILKVIPGILALTGILYFELMFFKMRVTEDFLITALLYAGLCMLGISSVSCFLKWLAPGESIKLEIKLILNLTILFAGLLINSTVADYNLSSAHIPLEWKPLFIVSGLILTIIGVGLMARKLNLKYYLTHKNKWIK